MALGGHHPNVPNPKHVSVDSVAGFPPKLVPASDLNWGMSLHSLPRMPLISLRCLQSHACLPFTLDACTN